MNQFGSFGSFGSFGKTFDDIEAHFLITKTDVQPVLYNEMFAPLQMGAIAEEKTTAQCGSNKQSVWIRTKQIKGLDFLRFLNNIESVFINL